MSTVEPLGSGFAAPSGVSAARGVSGRLADRLGQRELRRRLHHMAPGLLPMVLWLIPHADPVSPTLKGVLVGLCLLLGLTVFRRFDQISRSGESGMSAVIGYAGSVTVAALMFPHHLEFAMTVVAILAFGDGTATAAGKLWGDHKLPWNREKSWAGFAACAVCGSLVGTIYFYGEAQPGVDWGVAAVCASGGACAAAIAESIPSKLNDNIRVGLAALLGIATMQLAFIQ